MNKKEINTESDLISLLNSFPTVYKIEQAIVQPQSNVISKKENINWVLNGDNNSYPIFLSNLSSPIHQACIQTKSQMYAGEGITVDEKNINKKEIESWFKSISLSNTIKKLAVDISTVGYGFLQVQYSKAKKVVGINHIDCTTVALGKVNEDGIIDKYYISDNWALAEKKDEFKPIEFPAFDLNNIKSGSQIIMISPYYQPNNIYYSKPDYFSAIDHILLEKDIVDFWNNLISRGMFPSVMMTFLRGRNNADKSNENKFMQRLNEVYAGKDRQHTLVNFVDTMDEAPKIDSFPLSDLDKQFTILKEIISENIMTANRITHSGLFGIATPGSLGQSKELQTAYSILLNNVVYPVQIQIEESIEKIISVNWGEVKLNIIDSNPISFQIEDLAILKDVLTKDELREKIDYEPLTDNNSTQPSLAEVIGVGGMQALTGILIAPDLTNEQKLGILTNAFNIELDKAKEMVLGIAPPTSTPPTQTQTLNDLFKN